MKILLDFDGVLITAPAWKQAPLHPDGFLMFNECCVKNLNKIITATQANTIVLTTTHRIKYSIIEWKNLFKNRGITISDIEKVNNCNKLELMPKRKIEIEEWADGQAPLNFLILDDDLSLHELPPHIKSRWVKTSPLIGLSEEKVLEALAKQ